MTSNKAEDTRSQALENNPCNMCRAMGMPVCKGHGGGSGGGDSGGGSEASEGNDLEQTAATPESLHDVFSESTLWQHIDGTDDIYTYDAPLALLSIKLDLGAGSLVFSKHDNLSKEEEQELNKLLDTIEDELSAFKAELEAEGIDTKAIQCHRENGCLTIKLPTPKYFDTFVQRLTDKNLLLTDLPQKKHTLEKAATKNQDTPQPQKQTEINAIRVTSDALTIEEKLDLCSGDLRQLAETYLEKKESGYPENIYQLADLKAYFEDGLIEVLDELKNNNFDEDDEELLDFLKNQGKTRLAELSTQCAKSFESAPEKIQDQVHLILNSMDNIYDEGVNEIAGYLDNKTSIRPN